MTRTVAEAAKELELLKHERAVWMEIVEHLSRFVDQEVRAAEVRIVAEGCVENKVPQSVITEFIQYINDQEVDPLNEQIEGIEGLVVTETKRNEPKAKGAIKPKASNQTDQGAKPGPSGKKLRTISSHPGRKAQGSE